MLYLLYQISGVYYKCSRPDGPEFITKVLSGNTMSLNTVIQYIITITNVLAIHVHVFGIVFGLLSHTIEAQSGSGQALNMFIHSNLWSRVLTFDQGGEQMCTTHLLLRACGVLSKLGLFLGKLLTQVTHNLTHLFA